MEQTTQMNKDFVKSVRELQTDIRAPKDKYNSFGKYSYRSAEGILEAVKPLLLKHGLTLQLTDKIEQFGDRFYIKATAYLTDGEYTMQANGYAREPVSKKGMDESQITGTASSYARKYALNALLLLDDNKDADTEEHATEVANKPVEKVSNDQLKELLELCKEANREESYIANSMGVKKLEDLPFSKFNAVRKGLHTIIEKEKKEGKANE